MNLQQAVADHDLAIRMIKAGITPLFLEQETMPRIKMIAESKGFTTDEVLAVFERWDISQARKKIRNAKAEASRKTK